jgi:hypothetical protein
MLKPPTGTAPRIPTRVRRPWYRNYATYLDLFSTALFFGVPVAVFRIANGDWHTFPSSHDPLAWLHYPPYQAAAITAFALLVIGTAQDLAGHRRAADQFPGISRRAGQGRSYDTKTLAEVVERLVLAHGPISPGELCGLVMVEMGDAMPTPTAVWKVTRDASWLAPRRVGGPFVHVDTVRDAEPNADKAM